MGIKKGRVIGVIRGDTWSLDYSSQKRAVQVPGFAFFLFLTVYSTNPKPLPP